MDELYFGNWVINKKSGKQVLYYLIIAAFFFSCNMQENDNRQLRLANKMMNRYDTIRVDNVNDSVKNIDECKYLFDNFYFRFGVSIQKYFDVWDSLAIDLNSDERIDTLVILTPVSIIEAQYFNCRLNEHSDRILVETITNGKAKIRNQYRNIVSNIGGVLSKYNGMYLTKHGFEIHHTSGSRYAWHYITEFSTQQKDSIILIRIKKICSFDGFDENREYFYDKYSVGQINIIDTINNNCGCDSIWSELERKHITD